MPTAGEILNLAKGLARQSRLQRLIPIEDLASIGILKLMALREIPDDVALVATVIRRAFIDGVRSECGTKGGRRLLQSDRGAGATCNPWPQIEAACDVERIAKYSRLTDLERRAVDLRLAGFTASEAGAPNENAAHARLELARRKMRAYVAA